MGCTVKAGVSKPESAAHEPLLLALVPQAWAKLKLAGPNQGEDRGQAALPDLLHNHGITLYEHPPINAR